mgnify:CR=1 FL=1
MLFPWMKHNNLNWHQTIAQFMMSRRALWLLLAIMTGFVLITHQAVPMLDRDEARFSQASRQMAERDECEENENERLDLLHSLLSTAGVLLHAQVHRVQSISKVEQSNQIEILSDAHFPKEDVHN